ncbi:MAG: polyphosphate kinase 1 [Gemmatimonadetes bacterium]|nr:polyphosphate kinase 1 [Gemmatimonadota bacterium]
MSLPNSQITPATTPQEDPTEVGLGLSAMDERYVNRELSWLSFNERVLQEAESSSVPLLERINFLAIFSSNLDEFFRVRVASLRSLLRLRRKKRRKKGLDPTELLREIQAVTVAQQERFGQIFRDDILPGLQDAGIHLIGEEGADAEHRAIMEAYFVEHVAEHLEPMILGLEDTPPFLKDHTSYLVAELQPGPGIGMGTAGPELGIVEVPSPPLPRFLSTPGPGKTRNIVFLDDVIRLNLHLVFPERSVAGAYAIKLSRDADLYLDDEFDTGLRQAIKKSLGKRATGAPIRFLYDMRSPQAMLTRLSSCFELGEGDLIEGGRYHNLNDLAGLPVGDLPELEYGPLDPLPHPTLEGGPSSLDLIRAKDRLLHFPYQSYSYVVRLLKEAAADPDVDAIWISLYRVSRDSEVVKALIEAAENEKEVMAFVEVQARFDEELNLEWAERMELAGIRVIHGTREIKVHAKLCLIRRREGDASRLYALLATGNFNEKTARVYADHALMTADPRLTEEVRRVFRLLCGEDVQPDFEHLLVAPHHLRDRFNALIDAETEAARQGRPSGITAKMNSLQDRGIIDRLYDASAAGVPVRLIIRGICCLRPGVEGLSDSIEATSIVDRFLEHSRMFLFHADGAEKMYLSSADWMTRNLNRRVEVAFPIYDQDVFDELRHVLDLQCADNTKARIIDEHQRNRFVQEIEGATVRSQFDTYRYLRELLADNPGS